MAFQDLIMNTLFLLKEQPIFVDWIIVDEVQDSDQLQLDLIEAMKQEHTNIFAVGDPNQVIYSWRGSNLNVFYGLKHKYQAKEYTLSKNYRSSDCILKLAGRFLQNGGIIQGTKEMGDQVRVTKQYDSFQEACYLVDRIKTLQKQGIADEEIAVFYRLQNQSDVLKQVFAKNNIPYSITVKTSFSEYPVIAWLISVLRKECQEGKLKCIQSLEQLKDTIGLDEHLMPTVATYDEDKKQVTRFFVLLQEYIETKQVDYETGIKQFLNCAALYGTGFLEEEKSKNGVQLMTLHSSKGLEFDCVFILGVNQGLLPLLGKGMEQEEEERRLFFVGITRARKQLELTFYSNPDSKRVKPGPGNFLKMLPKGTVRQEDFEVISPQVDLRQMKRQILATRNDLSLFFEPTIDEVKVEEKEETKRIVHHEKYGNGQVIEEDDINITIDFEDYGVKQFMKAFTKLSDV